jgi:DNA transposition AAA+ family ATPase
MKDRVVVTENLELATAAMDRLQRKPERSDRLAAFIGKWGFSKTTWVLWWFANNLSFYVRAMAGWSRSVNWMVSDILNSYRIESRGRLKQDVQELVRVMKKHGVPLLIDEAQRVCRKSMLIETIRDLHDIARVPIVLVGQESTLSLLQRHDLGQVFSRITEVVEFRELSVEDIRQVAAELCDLTCDPQVASYIRKITLGDFRLLNTLLVATEELCLLNQTTEITQNIAKKASYAMPQLDGPQGVGRSGQIAPDPHTKVAVG